MVRDYALSGAVFDVHRLDAEGDDASEEVTQTHT
jgi:hypothetical protein